MIIKFKKRVTNSSKCSTVVYKQTLLKVHKKKKSYRGFFFKYRFISGFNDNIHNTPTHQFTRSSNWGENRPFLFDSHVATIEHRKVVMQSTYCRHGVELILVQKSTISILLDFNYLAAKCSSRSSVLQGRVSQTVRVIVILDHSLYLGILRDFRFYLQQHRSFNICKVQFGEVIRKASKHYSNRKKLKSQQQSDA